MKLHPIQRRWHAEDLVRQRRSDEQRRYAAPQRSGRIDANPHQIEAVMFALSRLGDGGCILADEVGLGKTIEAGLVIAQLRAEGARRILLITPKPLLGQWRQELYSLFGVEATDTSDGKAISSDGVFLIGREAAGSEGGRAMLLTAPPFDLVVIDEAHEVFGGLYKRFDAAGQLREEAPAARTAGRLFDIIRSGQGPVLLLTATPIQNSLSELWALVRYVDPTGTLLGDLRTFRHTFCDGDDRVIVEGQAEELRRRVSTVLRRTLRRQAQAFLSRPFVARQARLFEYPMAEEERRLYEDVTAYVMSGNGAAFQGNHRRLLLIGFHRRMASSAAALAATLEKVSARLSRMLEGASDTDRELVDDIVRDLEDEDLRDLDAADEQAEGAARSQEAIRAEIGRVEDFIARAKRLGEQGKSRALVEAARLIIARGREGHGSGKMVIFTESVVTQEYIRDLLVRSKLLTDQEVTLFRGTNNSPRAREALARWEAEQGSKLPSHSRPSREIAIRLALVHEFATQSKVFVSTEAGAKGLNLQFCETVINFDLPWNPQRIEQRIGRCHRYGQTRDVTVINFLAQDNETERLTFEILGQKLDLFGTVLDASDAVLHRAGEVSAESLVSAVGADLETTLNRIWQRARTMKDVEAELRDLRDRFDEVRRRFEDEQNRTSGLIETYFDEEVRRVFTRRRDELPAALAELDADLERVVTSYLEVVGVEYERRRLGDSSVLDIQRHGGLPDGLSSGLKVAVGRSNEHESLHLAHPLVMAAVEAARREQTTGRPVAIHVPADDTRLSAHRGCRGRLVGVRTQYRGMENVDRLVPIAVIQGQDDALPTELAQALLERPMRDHDTAIVPGVTDEQIADAVEEAMFRERRSLSLTDEPRFERGLEQLERFVEDRARLLRRSKDEAERRLEEARARRDSTVSLDSRERAEEVVVRIGSELETLERELAGLERRDDETYRRCRERLHQRRYAPASVETLFDVAFLLE